MVSTLHFTIALPTQVTEEIGLTNQAQARLIEKISEPLFLALETVSPRYLEQNDPQKCDRINFLFGIKEKNVLNGKMEGEEGESENGDEEEDEAHLASLDPRNWKNQDHYSVLGLQHLRYKATHDEIKKAYLRRALKHHPDKRAGQQKDRMEKDMGLGQPLDKERVFKCIQKAFDILSDPMKRQEFDSIDPDVDETLPSIDEMKNWVEKGTWYTNVNTLLEREKRFAVNPMDVPDLGDEESSKEHVDQLYEAWYHLDSWRRFDYLDKEEAQGENRDDKRYQDKKNKAERMKKLTLEKARLRTVIEVIEQTDPRMKLLKEKEKEMKKLMKQAKRQRGTPGGGPSPVTAQQQQQQPGQQQQDALKKEKQAQDLEALKREKELEKQRNLEIKQEKKFLRQWITKTVRYLVPEHEELKSSQMEKVLMDLEQLLETHCKEITLVQGLKHTLLQAYDEGGISQARQCFEAIVSGEQSIQAMPATTSFSSSDGVSKATESKDESQEQGAREVEPIDTVKGDPSQSRPWSSKELALLVKATNLFPGGATARWEKIAEYIAEHGHEGKRSIQEIIHQAKQFDPKHSTTTMMKNLQALQQEHATLEPKKNKIDITTPATLRDEAPPTAEERFEEAKKGVESENEVWTPQQQAQLQAALKKYPNTYKEVDRWDRIAEMVEGKNKKACIIRCKHLIEQLKLKQQQHQ